MRPPVPYFGSKGQMAPTIASLLPPHNHYVEVYAGSLAVLFAKAPSPLETVNDIDMELMTFYRVVRDRLDELSWQIDMTPHSRAEFELAARPPYPPYIGELEVARRVFVRLTQGRVGTLGATGWRYQVGAGKTVSMGDEIQRWRDRVRAAASRLRNVQIESRSALDMIARFGDDPDNLIYADPPYLGEVRNTGGTASGGGYRHEMIDPEHHVAMAKALNECEAAVVISGYRSSLYDELFSGWYVEEWPTQTVQGGARKAACEVLWSNRPLGGRHQPSLFDIEEGTNGSDELV